MHHTFINGIKVKLKKVVTFEEYNITKFIMLDSAIPIKLTLHD